MKKQTLRALAMLSLLVTLTVVSTYGASAGRITVHVPFGFTAGSQTFPAGTYEVTPVNMQGVLLIRSEDCRVAGMVLTQGLQTINPPANTRLGFRRYGEEYFLAEVWTGGSTDGRALPRTRKEREAAKGSAKHLAQNGSEPELVYVAAQ